MPRIPLIAALPLLLAACSGEPAAPQPPAGGVFAGAGRDRLCLAGQRAGLIVYAPGSDSNCSASGKVAGGALIPDGDAECRIPLVIAGERVRVGSVPASCAYYCGPGASLQGKAFGRRAGAKATDLAGDPLC